MIINDMKYKKEIYAILEFQNSFLLKMMYTLLNVFVFYNRLACFTKRNGDCTILEYDLNR